MYTLRIIEETRKDRRSAFEQVIENYSLGISYANLKNGITSEFDEVMRKEFSDHDPKQIKAIISGENGVKMFTMKDTSNKKYSYFIMTESGKTFERL